MKIITFAAVAFSACLMGAVAFADDATTTAPAAAPPKPAAAPVIRSAKSIECSKQADAKGLHGKERKKFESECKKAK